MMMQRITPRIALASAILGVITGIAIGLFNLLAEFQERREAALANTGRVLQTTLPLVETAYWEVDVARVKAILSGLLEDPLIEAAWIEDPLLTDNQRNTSGLNDLSVVKRTYRDIPGWLTWCCLRAETSRIETLGMVSPRDGAPLGELKARLSFVSVMNEFAGRVFVVLGLSMLQTLFVTAAIFIIVQIMVIRPLTQLQQATVDLREEKGFKRPDLAQSVFDQNRKDEISRLGRAFLRTFNALEDSRQTLQQNVDDRTAELKLARNEAIEASEAKSQFLANMNHELRTPLNAITGLSVVLDNHDLPAQSRPLVRDIRSAARQLSANIDSVLDLSKIEAGEMEVFPEWFSLKELSDSIAAQTRALLIDKKPELTCHFEFDRETEIYADPTRLRQVVMNFASNAVKFTDEGRIELSVQFTPELNEDKGQLTFSVTDTGIGIPNDKIDEVFRPFGQLDGSRSRRHEGTGLGMSIAQHLTKALGGEITVESEVGQGSNFTLTLSERYRISTEPQFDAPLPDMNDLDGALIMVIEDNRINRSVFVALLEQGGARVVTAPDGLQALDLVQKQLPDAILMDLHMPRSDGFNTMTQMCKTLGFALPPVVATSADATTSQKKKCKDAGFFEFISKPVDAEALRTVMKKAVEFGSVIDRKRGLGYSGGDIALFSNTLNRLHQQTNEWQADLPKARPHARADMIHVIKGAAGTAGATAIAEQAKETENDIKDVSALLAAMERFTDYIDQMPRQQLPSMTMQAFEHLEMLVEARNPDALEFFDRFNQSGDIALRLKRNLSKLRFAVAKLDIRALRQLL